jgi:hypothetical protein
MYAHTYSTSHVCLFSACCVECEVVGRMSVKPCILCMVFYLSLSFCSLQCMVSCFGVCFSSPLLCVVALSSICFLSIIYAHYTFRGPHLKEVPSTILISLHHLGRSSIPHSIPVLKDGNRSCLLHSLFITGLFTTI